MLLLTFLNSAAPVMVQTANTCGRKKNYKVQFLEKDTDSCVDSPIICKLKKRRKARSKSVLQRKAMLEAISRNPYLDYPFLRDAKTRQVIQKSHVLFIMRGLSGSGKSTIARAITTTYPNSWVCSADDYFLRDGEYHFDATQLSLAHESCQNAVKACCNTGMNVVVVDNTTVRRWEARFYLELAARRDYVVVPVQPLTPWCFNPTELATRNKHNVDVATLRRKVSQFDDIIPIYYGWFLNAAASTQLADVANCWLKECLQLFPALAEQLLSHLYVSASDFDSAQGQHSPKDAVTVAEGVWEVLKSYYGRGKREGCLVHCTAKFCGCGKAVGAKAYHASPAVQAAVGQAFDLHISALCFTPRSAGAIVRLDETQMALFDKPEERGWTGSPPKAAVARSPGGLKGHNSPSPNNHRKQAKGGRSKGARGGDPVRQEEDNSAADWPPKRGSAPAPTKPVATGRGRSAHITIGSAPGVESRETNFDMLRLCDLEVMKPASESNQVTLKGGRVRYFGDGVCCVYLDSPLTFSTIYSGLY